MQTSLIYNLLGLVVAVALCLVIVGAYARTLKDRQLRRLLWLGFSTRVAGSCGMFGIIVYTYGGGDALPYVAEAQLFANALTSLDLQFYANPVNWWGEQWWGSQFVVFVCSFTAVVFGSLVLPQFFLFSMAAFSGMWFLLLAFRRTYPQADWYRFGLLALSLPSVWFWSSSVGKEAIVMLGAGLAFGGLARLRNARNVGWLLIGLLLIFAIRPQVASVAGAAIAFGYLVARWKTLKPQTIIVGMLLIGGALFVAVRGAETLGLDAAGVEYAREYVERTSATADYGTTSVDAPGTGVAAIPGGLVNILFRPFPWEITSVTSAVASLEMVFLWSIVCLRFPRMWRFARSLAQSPLFVASFTFAGTYAALLGLVVFNMGIITRQRVLILPLIMLVVHFVPKRSPAARKRSKSPELLPVETEVASGETMPNGDGSQAVSRSADFVEK